MPLHLLEILDRASSLKDRENTHSGPSGTDGAGGTPSTDARRASPRRSAPNYQSPVPAPADAGRLQSSTRTSPTACLKASSHPTVERSLTICDPGCSRCRYLATAEIQSQLGGLLQFIWYLAPHSARTNFEPRSHDLRSPTHGARRLAFG